MEIDNGKIDLGLHLPKDYMGEAIAAEERLMQEFKLWESHGANFKEKAQSDYAQYLTNNRHADFDVFKKLQKKKLTNDISLIEKVFNAEMLLGYEGYNTALSYMNYLERITCDDIDPVNDIYVNQDVITLVLKQKEERTVFDNWDAALPIDYIAWLDLIDKLPDDKKEFRLKELILVLESNITKAERKEGRLPTQFYQALEEYKLTLNILTLRRKYDRESSDDPPGQDNTKYSNGQKPELTIQHIYSHWKGRDDSPFKGYSLSDFEQRINDKTLHTCLGAKNGGKCKTYYTIGLIGDIKGEEWRKKYVERLGIENHQLKKNRDKKLAKFCENFQVLGQNKDI